MKKRTLEQIGLMVLIICIAGTAAFFTVSWARVTQVPYAETQVEAVQRAERYAQAIRGYKEELGIPMSPDDLHGTGLIGEPFTGITTTQGSLESKRTAAWPEMGALCVRMLWEAGVRPGDTVGAGFSGSFPGMNLAVVAACESMDVKLICIASVGASTFGANNPELTFPEMLDRLAEDSLITTRCAMVTMGGDMDVGRDMDTELRSSIRDRLISRGLPYDENEDYPSNLEAREAIYRERGPIRCFIAVGGNMTSQGRGEAGSSLGQGVLRPSDRIRLNESSGLVQRFLVRGIPVLNLLNLKQIMAEYGLPFDPGTWPQSGTSSVYASIQYDRALPIAGLILILFLLVLFRLFRYRASKTKIFNN